MIGVLILEYLFRVADGPHLEAHTMSQQQAPCNTKPMGESELYAKLLQIMTWDQLVFLTNVLLEAHIDARQTESEQTVQIVVNTRGYPRHCNRIVGTNFPKP